MAGDEMLTTEQAAAELAVAPKTLRNWRTLGGGPRAVKYGPGRTAPVRYPRSELERWKRRNLEVRTHEKAS